MRKSIMALGILGGALLSSGIAGPAMAQDNTQPPPAPPPSEAPVGTVAASVVPESGAPALNGVSLFGILGYFNAVGVGARYMLPVGIPSLIRHGRIKDSWAVEFGADLLYWSLDAFGVNYHETELLPIGGLMWNVWLNPKFAVYPKAEIGFGINVAGSRNNTVGHSGIYPSGAGGLLYQVSNAITLRAEIGVSGLRGGLGFFF